MSPCGVVSCAERTSCGRHHCLPSGCLPLWGASAPPCLPCTSNGGCVFWGCARREVPRAVGGAHLWGHEKSGCAVGAVPPSLVPSKVLPYLSGTPLGEQPLPVLHNGCRSCRTGMDLEVVNAPPSPSPNTHPTPYATHTSRHAPRSTTHPSPSTQSTSPTPHTPHATHPYPSNPKTAKNPRGTLPSTTPNARYYLHQEPCTPHTDRNRSTIHAPARPLTSCPRAHTPRGTLHVPQSTLTPCTYTTRETHTQNTPSAPTTHPHHQGPAPHPKSTPHPQNTTPPQTTKHPPTPHRTHPIQ